MKMPTEVVSTPHVIEVTQALNGTMGPKIESVAKNLKSIRAGILSKMQNESKQKYFQIKYNIEPKASTQIAVEEDDIYSDIDNFLK